MSDRFVPNLSFEELLLIIASLQRTLDETTRLLHTGYGLFSIEKTKVVSLETQKEQLKNQLQEALRNLGEYEEWVEKLQQKNRELQQENQRLKSAAQGTSVTQVDASAALSHEDNLPSLFAGCPVPGLCSEFPSPSPDVSDDTPVDSEDRIALV